MRKKPGKPSKGKSQDEKTPTPASTTQTSDSANPIGRQPEPADRSERNNAENDFIQTRASPSNEAPGEVLPPSHNEGNATPSDRVPKSVQQPSPIRRQGPTISLQETGDLVNPNPARSGTDVQNSAPEASTLVPGRSVTKSGKPNSRASGDVPSVSRLEKHRPSPITIPSSKTGIDDHLAGIESIHPISQRTSPSTSAPSTTIPSASTPSAFTTSVSTPRTSADPRHVHATSVYMSPARATVPGNDYRSPTSLDGLSPFLRDLADVRRRYERAINPRPIARGLIPWVSPVSPHMTTGRLAERSPDPLRHEEVEALEHGVDHGETDMDSDTPPGSSDDRDAPVEAAPSGPQGTEEQPHLNDGMSHQAVHVSNELFTPRPPQTPRYETPHIPNTPNFLRTPRFPETPRFLETPRSSTPSSSDIQSKTPHSFLPPGTPRPHTPRLRNSRMPRLPISLATSQPLPELSLGCNRSDFIPSASTQGQGSAANNTEQYVHHEENGSSHSSRYRQSLNKSRSVPRGTSNLQEIPSVMPSAPRKPRAPRIPKTTSRILRVETGSLQTPPTGDSRLRESTLPVTADARQNATNTPPLSPTAITDFPGDEQQANLRSTGQEAYQALDDRQGFDSSASTDDARERSKTDRARESDGSEEEKRVEPRISTPSCKPPRHPGKRDEDDDAPGGSAGNHGTGKVLSRTTLISRKRSSITDNQPRKRQPRGRGQSKNSTQKDNCWNSKDRGSNGPNPTTERDPLPNPSSPTDRSRKCNLPPGTLPVSRTEQLQSNWKHLETYQGRSKKEMVTIPENFANRSTGRSDTHGNGRAEAEGPKDSGMSTGQSSRNQSTIPQDKVTSIVKNDFEGDHRENMSKAPGSGPIELLRSDEQPEARNGASVTHRPSVSKGTESNAQQVSAAKILKKSTSEPRRGRDSPEIEAWLEKPRLPKPKRYFGEHVIRSKDIIIYETSPTPVRSRNSDIPTPRRGQSLAERQERLRQYRARARPATDRAAQESGGQVDIDLIRLNIGTPGDVLQNVDDQDAQEPPSETKNAP